MIECQLGSLIGLPKEPNLQGFSSAWKHSQKDHVKSEQVKDYICEYLFTQGLTDLKRDFEEWDPPVFPVNGHDLISEGCPKGRLMSLVTDALKVKWRDSDYK
ncbi:CCA tRNA nucleotidyltransferase 1 mitochondriallike [Caligus rogercresseyi]|uniref:CCA tRNA nucleotidyltransferase 1 mitochondriallike n=1 Tax=Caligus rogercresseyi TaxID=217165 RepID=A0A7T8K0I8_CALRO|nr:CCA tRNA nucleotidyltransferase 1 mitochondriallike [Caligus rogercresseyi]